MKNLSFFKKIKLLIYYFRILKKYKPILLNKKSGLDLRIDRSGRIYTVCNCSEDVAKYGSNLAEKEIKEFISKCDKFFVNNCPQLIEMIGIRDVSKLTERDYLIVFGFKGLYTPVFFRNLIIISLLSITTFLLIFFNIL